MSPAVGVLSASGLYTAPSSISATQTVTITATSAAQPSESVSATVILQAGGTLTVTPGSVVITPLSHPSLQFTASVSGSATAVFWKMIIPPGSTYSAAVYGTLFSNGLYIAPASIGKTLTFTIQATEAANPTQSATASVRLSPNWR
jgi:hypothetical protein